MLYSQIKGKNVYTIEGAEVLGEISGVYIDRNTYTVKYLLLSNAQKRILPFNDVFSAGDAVLVRSSQCLLDEDIAADCIFFDIDVSVYDVDGNYLGDAGELDLDLKYDSREFWVNDVNIKLKTIVSSSAQVIIVNPKYKALKPRVKQPKQIKEQTETDTVKENAPVETEPQSAPQNNAPYIEINLPEEKGSSQNETTVKEEPRAANDYSFLLGRKVFRDIQDIGRTFIIYAGTVIDETAVEKAKKAGKLVELTINSTKQ